MMINTPNKLFLLVHSPFSISFLTVDFLLRH
jgi:hypothetical protein